MNEGWVGVALMFLMEVATIVFIVGAKFSNVAVVLECLMSNGYVVGG